MRFRAILTAALLAAAAPALEAATILTFQEAAPGAVSQPKLVRTLTVDGERLRVETTGKEADGRVLIFHAGTGTLWVLNPVESTYTELHRSIVPFNVEEAPAAAEEVKAGKPGRGVKAGKDAKAAEPSAPPGVTVYKKVDSGFIVDGFRTDKLEGTRDGRKVEEVYVAEPKALGLDAQDMKTLQTLASTFADQGKGDARLGLSPGVPGVAVRTVRFEGGQPTLQIDLAGVRQVEAASSAFEIPAGFTRQGQGLASP